MNNDHTMVCGTKRNACHEGLRRHSEVKNPYNRDIHITKIGKQLHALYVIPPRKVTPLPFQPPISNRQNMKSISEVIPQSLQLQVRATLGSLG